MWFRVSLHEVTTNTGGTIVSDRQSAKPFALLAVHRPSPAAAGLCGVVTVWAAKWLDVIPEGPAVAAAVGVVGAVMIKDCISRDPDAPRGSHKQ